MTSLLALLLLEKPCDRIVREIYGRYAVLWRTHSLEMASDKGNRWVDRISSLKETCQLRAVSTYNVLVDAMTSFFTGQQPDLVWLDSSALNRLSLPNII
jgi:hypothetical protein